jgi:hypothetical protein
MKFNILTTLLLCFKLALALDKSLNTLRLADVVLESRNQRLENDIGNEKIKVQNYSSKYGVNDPKSEKLKNWLSSQQEILAKNKALDQKFDTLIDNRAATYNPFDENDMDTIKSVDLFLEKDAIAIQKRLDVAKQKLVEMRQTFGADDPQTLTQLRKFKALQGKIILNEIIEKQMDKIISPISDSTILLDCYTD